MADPDFLLLTLTTKVSRLPKTVDIKEEFEASNLPVLEFASKKTEDLADLFYMDSIVESLNGILMTELPNPLDSINFLSQDDDIDFGKVSVFMRELYSSFSFLTNFKEKTMKFLRTVKQVKTYVDLYRKNMIGFLTEQMPPSERTNVVYKLNQTIDGFISTITPQLMDVQKLITDDLAQKERILLRSESSLRLLVNVYNTDMEKRLSYPRTKQPYSLNS